LLRPKGHSSSLARPLSTFELSIALTPNDMRRLPPKYDPKNRPSEEETNDPHIADHRNFYKVEKWMKDGLKIDRMLYAGSDLTKAQARESAQAIMSVGKSLNDPRCTSAGLWVLTWIALGSDSYGEALNYSEQSLATAITPLDRSIAMGAMGNALVMLRRLDEAVATLNQQRRHCIENGFSYNIAGSDPFVALSKIFRGEISAGISFLKRQS
jgi:hypothetical protein